MSGNKLASSLLRTIDNAIRHKTIDIRKAKTQLNVLLKGHRDLANWVSIHEELARQLESFRADILKVIGYFQDSDEFSLDELTALQELRIVLANFPNIINNPQSLASLLEDVNVRVVEQALMYLREKNSDKLD